MNWVRRLGGGLLAIAFLTALLGRSVTANPAVRSMLQDGTSKVGLLLALPLVALSVAILAVRFRGQFGGDDDESRYESQYAPVESNSWDRGSGARPTGDSPTGAGTRVGAESAQTPEGTEPDDVTNTTANSSTASDSPDSDLDIEAEPPDASLRDHLDHLQTELADDDDARPDLQRLESVVDEVEGERTIPRRCPGEHCDAIWSERTVFGDDRGEYAVLEDGERVLCLECERVFGLE